ncbi:MAG: nucleotidyltransferase domain-containing protein [Pseudobdellovibrionaceae bacterium]
MRISKDFVSFLKQQVLSLDPQAKLFLFGSRIQDHLQGGDIDLLVLSDLISFSQKIDLLVQLKMKFGEQKIDLKVSPRSSQKQDPFVAEILKEALEL